MRIFKKTDEIFIKHPATTDEKGAVHWPRRDGTTTIIGRDYWDSASRLGNIPELYNKLAPLTELSIIGAGQDEVLGAVDYSEMDENTEISLIEKAGHNFTGDSRVEMIEKIKAILD